MEPNTGIQNRGSEPTNNKNDEEPEERLPITKILFFSFLSLAILGLIFFSVYFFMIQEKEGENPRQSTACSNLGIIFNQMNCSYIQNRTRYEINLSFLVDEGNMSFSNLFYIMSFQSGNPSSDEVSTLSLNDIEKINFTSIRAPNEFHLIGNFITEDSCFSQTVSCVSLGVIEEPPEGVIEEPPEEEEQGSDVIPPPQPLPS